jgi:hypothetical protein
VSSTVTERLFLATRRKKELYFILERTLDSCKEKEPAPNPGYPFLRRRYKHGWRQHSSTPRACHLPLW